MFTRTLAVAVIALSLSANAAFAAKADKAAKKAAFDADKAFKQLDTNSDGKLSADEFKSLTTTLGKLPKKSPAPDAESVFKKLDANTDGSVSADEFKGVTDSIPKKKKAK